MKNCGIPFGEILKSSRSDTSIIHYSLFILLYN